VRYVARVHYVDESGGSESPDRELLHTGDGDSVTHRRAGAVPGLALDFLALKRRYFPRRFNTGLAFDEVLKGNEVLQKNLSQYPTELNSTRASHCQASSLRDCSPSESGHFSPAIRTPQTSFRHHLRPRGRAGAWTVAGFHPPHPTRPTTHADAAG
jgi:hypothetical protein